MLVGPLRNGVWHWLEIALGRHRHQLHLGGALQLPASAVLPEHTVCTDLPDLPPTELALISREGALTGLQQWLVEFLREELGKA